MRNLPIIFVSSIGEDIRGIHLVKRSLTDLSSLTKGIASIAKWGIAANFRPLSAFRSAGSGGNAGQAGDYPAHERIDREKKRERDERPWRGMVPHERTLAEHA